MLSQARLGIVHLEIQRTASGAAVCAVRCLLLLLQWKLSRLVTGARQHLVQCCAHSSTEVAGIWMPVWVPSQLMMHVHGGHGEAESALPSVQFYLQHSG